MPVFADDPVATEFLGRVKRLVCPFNKCADLFCGMIRGNPERDRDGPEIAIRTFPDETFGSDGFPDVFRDRGRASTRRVRQDNGEFLASVTRGGVFSLQGAMKRASDEPQHLIAKLVPMGVVKILEIVDIRKNKRQGLAIGL